MSESEQTKHKYLKSVFLTVGSYLLMLLVLFLIIVTNDTANWQSYMVDHFSEILSLIVSVFFLFGMVFFYYYFEERDFFAHTKNLALSYTIIIVSAIVCFIFGRYVNIHSRPFALFAILALFLLNRRQALFLNFVFAFLMFVIDLFTNTFSAAEINSEVYSSLMLSFVSGTLTVFVTGKVRTRGGLLLTGIFIAIPTAVIVLLFNLPTVTYDWIDYVSSAGFRIMGCVVAAILALAMLPPFEWVFNRLTVFRLRELTSTNAPLLKRLQDEAPGTFNHSLIVAQLSETCAVAIGENAELARTCAYYHDVGKLKQPDCFTENQGDYNLHDEIPPELSADIIRSHTKDGYELLIVNHIPKVIADVALEHHGTLPIKYFYDKAMRYSGDADLKDFSYLGPLPQTKIAAILMIADAAEAATRAAADRSPEAVEKVCRAIIEERMDLGQFDECDITMKQLTVIKQTLVEALSGVHHHRVKYPSIRFNRDRQAVSTAPQDGEDDE